MRENSLHAGLDQVIVHHFRNRLREAVDKDREGWIASRRLVTPEAAPETIRRLRGVVAARRRLDQAPAARHDHFVDQPCVRVRNVDDPRPSPGAGEDGSGRRRTIARAVEQN